MRKSEQLAVERSIGSEVGGAKRRGGRSSAARRHGLWLVIGAIALCCSWSEVSAAAGPAAGEESFLGFPVKGPGGDYAATKDVDVRAEPKTGSRRLGRLHEGEWVAVVGRAKGSWMAVRPRSGAPGFVYGPALIPVVDGRIIGPITGKATSADGVVCEFVIRFDGHTPIEGEPFRSADYRAKLDCMSNGRLLAVELPMFITEGPYNGGQLPIHQIGIDVLELSKDYDQVFSTYLLFDRTKGEVRFDTVNLKDYWSRKPVSPVPAPTVKTALAGALTLAVRGWNARVWADLAKALEDQAKG